MNAQNTTSYADNNERLISALYAIDPATLQYNEWLNVGMGLHAEGLDISVWDSWSQRDPAKYKGLRDLENHWKSFTPGKGITGGTIIHMAEANGWESPKQGRQYVGRAVGWDENYECSASYAPTSSANRASYIPQKPSVVPYKLRDLDMNKQLENAMPEDMTPIDQAAMYLHTMFKPGEYVCLPSSPADSAPMTYEVEYLLKTLQEENVTAEGFNSIFGEEGRYIVINPTDGQGRKNENITAFRHVLLESDDIPTDKQQQLMLALNLPITAIVDSGNKSIHAAVRIDAKGREEYDRRVRFLYDVCKANGLEPDEACKNPARMTRFPGCMRTVHKWDGTKPKDFLDQPKKQRLIALQNGAGSWDEWEQWYKQQPKEQPVEELTEMSVDDIKRDFYPQIEWVEDYMGDNLPPLPPAYVEGLLYPSSKLGISAPAKSKKTWLCLGLGLSIAIGRSWFGFKCQKLKVLYINVELDNRFFRHRVEKVRRALNISESEIQNQFAHVTLRGKAANVNEIQIALGDNINMFDVVILDPIGKLIEGDENSNSDVNKFAADLDRVFLTNGKTAIIYVHHMGKGEHSGKRVGERSRGASALFGDVDTAIDILPLAPTDGAAEEYIRLNTKHVNGSVLKPQPMRLEFATRNAAEPKPVNAWFEYPVFIQDITNTLSDCAFEDSREAEKYEASKKGGDTSAENKKAQWGDKNARIQEAINRCIEDGQKPTAKEIHGYYQIVCAEAGEKGTTDKNFFKWLKPSSKTINFIINEDGCVVPTPAEPEAEQPADLVTDPTTTTEAA